MIIGECESIHKNHFTEGIFRLEFADVPISNLARESRLVLHVFGRTLNTSESEESKNSNMPMYKEEELGWAAIQFFDYEGLV